jgi:chromosome segregation ATPase
VSFVDSCYNATGVMEYFRSKSMAHQYIVITLQDDTSFVVADADA